ncbi:MAG: ABC transporter permease subunit [Acidimicrobiales bacterium]
MSASAINVTRRPGAHRSWIRRHAVSLAFLAPAAIWLLFIVVWPTIDTVRLSLFNESATKFLGLTNYKTVFSTDTILTAFRNNVIWVLIFPFFVTTIGLIFAVLTERIRWATAFKALVVMPIVFSTTASALVWATIFDNSPQIGAVNAAALTISDWFNPPGAYPVSTTAGQTVADLVGSNSRAAKNSTIESLSSAKAGGMINIGLRDVTPATLTVLKAQKAVKPQPMSGAITGVVWRAFSPSAPTNTKDILPGELGLPQLRLSLVNAQGAIVASTTTTTSGQYKFSNVGSGMYFVELVSSNFSSGFTGISWLGGSSLTPVSGLNQTAQALLSVPLADMAMIITYLWIWAGFAMVLIAAGLASLNREVLEAARIDGAKEWQVFRRVTVPMLSPVLAVVFVTMIINVLKVFDIVLNMASGSSVNATPTLAVEIYNDGFTGGVHSGVSSAIAVILFLLVLPAMIMNLKRIKGV